MVNMFTVHSVEVIQVPLYAVSEDWQASLANFTTLNIPENR